MPVRFFLRLDKVKKNNEIPIYVDVHFLGIRIQKYTGESCLKKDFLEPDKHSSGRYVKGNTTLNDQLYFYEIKIEERCRQAKREGQDISPSDIDLILKPKKKVEAVEIVQDRTVRSYLERWKERNKNLLAHNTLRKQDPTMLHLDNFCPNSTIDMIDERFVERYIEYLLDEVETIQSNNTIDLHIKFFRTILREAGLNADWLKTNYTFQADKPFLLFDELLKFYQFNYSTEGLRAHADAGSFLGFTGLRHSDALRLGKSDLIEDENGKYIQLKQVKTKKQVRMYLNKYAIEIINKYEGKQKLQLVPIYSNQDMNKALKECAKSCRLNREVNKVIYRGTKRVSIVEPLHDTIGCHTFRHTYATISLNNGMPAQILAEQMGITLNTVSIYAKLLSKTKADEVNKVWG